ncbi:MAG: hypothetical protein HGB12_07455 [Bacteroidetes bacterium]|nr:hypothetical protein [Bacteroidota bacterium]
MKKFFIINSILFLIFPAFGQNVNIDSIVFSHDTILNKIISFIPHNWIYYTKGNDMIFERGDSSYVLHENRVNAPKKNETKTQQNERIVKNGTKIKSKIVLKFEEKWDYNKMIVIKNNNAYLYKNLQSLPDKYNINNLYDSTLSTKSNAVYIGKTKSEKNKIDKYLKEKDEILSKVTAKPNYNTQKYSFFIKELIGCNDDNNFAYPENASAELYQILSVFFELSSK